MMPPLRTCGITGASAGAANIFQSATRMGNQGRWWRIIRRPPLNEGSGE
jgi:hypothetical protein